MPFLTNSNELQRIQNALARVVTHTSNLNTSQQCSKITLASDLNLRFYVFLEILHEILRVFRDSDMGRVYDMKLFIYIGYVTVHEILRIYTLGVSFAWLHSLTGQC